VDLILEPWIKAFVSCENAPHAGKDQVHRCTWHSNASLYPSVAVVPFRLISTLRGGIQRFSGESQRFAAASSGRPLHTCLASQCTLKHRDGFLRDFPQLFGFLAAKRRDAFDC
jgi:hypothetical protein